MLPSQFVVVHPIPAIESVDVEHSTPAVDIADLSPTLEMDYAIAEEKLNAVCENLKNAILNKFKTKKKTQFLYQE